MSGIAPASATGTAPYAQFRLDDLVALDFETKALDVDAGALSVPAPAARPAAAPSTPAPSAAPAPALVSSARTASAASAAAALRAAVKVDFVWKARPAAASRIPAPSAAPFSPARPASVDDSACYNKRKPLVRPLPAGAAASASAAFRGKFDFLSKAGPAAAPSTPAPFAAPAPAPLVRSARLLKIQFGAELNAIRIKAVKSVIGESKPLGAAATASIESTLRSAKLPRGNPVAPKAEVEQGKFPPKGGKK